MKTNLALLLGFAILWAPFSARPQPNGHSVDEGRAVDCDNGGVIARALEKLRPGDTLLISGTCRENVEIGETLRHITLEGRGVEPGISAPDNTIDALRIYGDQVTVRGLTISGGRDGINLRGAMGAVIERNILQDNASAGLNIHRISWATVKDNVIRRNGTFGIMVYENSSARIGFTENAQPEPSPNIIEDNRNFGVFVSRSSQADIAGNIIRRNVNNGIQVDRNSQAEIGSNDISQNTGNAINAQFGAGVNLGTPTGTRWQIRANTSTLANERFAFSCSTGGYITGNRGTLLGKEGVRLIASGCIDTVVPLP